MTTPIENLRAARALISDSEKWGQNYYALDLDGNPLDRFRLGPDAASNVSCACALGALLLVGVKEHEFLSSWEVRALAAAVPRPSLRDPTAISSYSVWSYNDDDDATTHADVLAMFDRAIASLEAETCRP